MEKKLSEMTLEELWGLFPIYLTEHKTIWENQYKDEEKNLRNILKYISIKRISHIGSTSISSIWAKPIVDILIEVSEEVELKTLSDLIVDKGYTCMYNDENRVSLNKCYTENGFAEEVFHLHLRYEGDNDELYFRDYLKDNLDVAKDYEKLKLCLWKKFEHNRDAYTDAKTEFIKKYTDIAKSEYFNRY